MKLKLVILSVLGLASVGYLYAQDGAPTSLAIPKVDGTPTLLADKGAVVAAASEDALWLKAGGRDTNNWTRVVFVPAAVTMTSGVATVTNTALTTNSVIFVSSMGN